MEATAPVVALPGLVRLLLLPLFLVLSATVPQKRVAVGCGRPLRPDPRKKWRRCGAPRRSTRAAGAARGTVEWPRGGVLCRVDLCFFFFSVLGLGFGLSVWNLFYPDLDLLTR